MQKKSIQKDLSLIIFAPSMQDFFFEIFLLQYLKDVRVYNSYI